MNKHALLLLFVGLLSCSLCHAQSLNKSDWTVYSDDNKPGALTDTIYMGKPCVKLNGASKSIAWNKKVNCRNFRIDLDIAGEVMSGVGFHVADELNYQFLYFRPGYGGTIEATQYIPIFNGALSWVIYSAYQAAAETKKLEWFHVALEVRGQNLKVFVNQNSKPAMDITMVNTDAKSGGILLRSMFGNSYFANVSIREWAAYITDWEISEQLPRNTSYDYAQVSKIKEWTKINEIEDNYVNFCRYFKNPDGVVVAKHAVQSTADISKPLNFDFIGKLKIILNGKEVFNYDKYQLDRIPDVNNRILLDLKKGNNELIFISEGDAFVFGKGYKSIGRLQHQNWGFICSL